MELFGYVCSPLCRQRADLRGIEVPEFAGQKSVSERRQWRKVGLVVGIAAVFVAALVGAWVWYEFIGSHPHPVYSFRFSEPSYSGRSFLCGDNQIVFLHGDELARHDLKAKKEIWSRRLVDKKNIDEQVQRTLKEYRDMQAELNNKHPDADPIKIPSPEKLAEQLARSAASALDLHVRGQNVWVALPDKLVRYDWNTGQPAQEIPLSGGLGGALARGDEMILLNESDSGGRAVVHVNLATGQKRVEEISGPAKTAAVIAKSPDSKTGSTAPKPGATKTLDPDKVASQVQNLPLPAKTALPATLGIARQQQLALAELRGQDANAARAAGKSAPPPEIEDMFALIPGADGFVEFSVALLEEKITTRVAMKAKPKKSALDGNVNQAATMDIANEILNDIQRDAGGDTVTENESRYGVAVRLPAAKDAPVWKGEVIGPPALHPLKTVNVVTSGKGIIVLDKANKKKWEASLTFPVSGGRFSFDDEAASSGLGPCVERSDTLYVFDAGVLSAFDLATGNARWRLPSVGISGLFFDDDGMIYVNSTTASPDKIKYSKQIDVTDPTGNVVLKLDPKNGKTLWTSGLAGHINHLSGKFIYTVSSYQADEDEEPNPYLPMASRGSSLNIQRINPKNGKIMWVHPQERAPLDVQFDKNVIHLVFKKEVQVLKFLAF